MSLAAKSDLAIVVAGYASNLESEGFDRTTLNLPAGQDDLIRAVAAANKNTIVVINAGSPVAMDWIEQTSRGFGYVVRRAGGWPRDRFSAFRRCKSVGQIARHVPKENRGFAGVWKLSRHESSCRLRGGNLRRLSAFRHAGHPAVVSFRPWSFLYEIRIVGDSRFRRQRSR